MQTLTHRRRHAHLMLAAVVSGLAMAAMVLCRFPPEQYSFYPQCPFYELTGWQCPGCGMTRALAALLRGHLVEAMRWNPLVFVVVPAALAGAALAYRRALAADPTPWPRLSNVRLGASLAALVLFALGRNLL